MTPSERVHYEPLWRHMTPQTRALALGWHRVSTAIRRVRRQLTRLAESL